MKKLTIATLSLLLLTACGSTSKTGSASKEIDNYGATETITVDVTLSGDSITEININETYSGSTKRDLGNDYNMAGTSQAIGKITENSGEWFEQVDYLQNYIIENGIDAVVLDDSGYPTGDLTAGCTIYLGNIMETINDAIASAE